MAKEVKYNRRVVQRTIQALPLGLTRDRGVVVVTRGTGPAVTEIEDLVVLYNLLVLPTRIRGRVVPAQVPGELGRGVGTTRSFAPPAHPLRNVWDGTSSSVCSGMVRNRGILVTVGFQNCTFLRAALVACVGIESSRSHGKGRELVSMV